MMMVSIQLISTQTLMVQYSLNYLDTDTLISAFDRQGLVGYKEDKPLITNAIVTQMGKKNNQSILQSKLDR
jgi:hypothetical protein